MKKFLVVAFIIISPCAFSSAQAVEVTLRLGQGGLREDRAPDGVLGGGQLAVDVKLGERPIAISISQEYHKKDPVPDSSYEIGSLVAVNVLYMTQVIKERANVFLGGGIGGLSAPRIGDPETMERGFLFDLVGGVNVKAFWKIGIYAEVKYIYSRKTIDNIKVIDFSNPGFLVGISLNLGR